LSELRAIGLQTAAQTALHSLTTASELFTCDSQPLSEKRIVSDCLQQVT